MECQPNWTTDHIHAFNERIMQKNQETLQYVQKHITIRLLVTSPK